MEHAPIAIRHDAIRYTDMTRTPVCGCTMVQPYKAGTPKVKAGTDLPSSPPAFSAIDVQGFLLILQS